jgi:ubiquinone/menaquinone biosynthesis C-methylase UbiE
MASDLYAQARRFSKQYPIMNDLDRRRRKGRKVAAILKEVLQKRKVHYVLDVGCSNAVLLKTVQSVLDPVLAIGLDMDSAVLPKPAPQLCTLVGDAMAIPITSESVDVVLCNHTYEHVPDATKLFDEIKRVLKPGGIVYFGAMNSHWPIEPHYHIPFLHWLPSRLAGLTLRVFGHPSGYLDRPFSMTQLRHLVSDFELHDYTLTVISSPSRYDAGDVIPRSMANFLYPLAKLFYRFLPGYLWILVKREAPENL